MSFKHIFMELIMKIICKTTNNFIFLNYTCKKFSIIKLVFV